MTIDELFTRDEKRIKKLYDTELLAKLLLLNYEFSNSKYHNVNATDILNNLHKVRTSIETCYERTLNRWKSKNEFNEEEFNKFANKKIGMFEWYKSLNEFLKEVDKL